MNEKAFYPDALFVYGPYLPIGGESIGPPLWLVVAASVVVLVSAIGSIIVVLRGRGRW